MLPNQFYHIFNQGNNKQKIFFEEANYVFFLGKVRKYISPVANVLGYCLMPNHFHFLIYTDERTCVSKRVGGIELTALTNGFRILESSYAQAINKRFKRTGSLFRQKTKFKFVEDLNHATACLHYIHQNPKKAGLVNLMEDWRYSSFASYKNMISDGLCDPELGTALLRLR